MDLQFSEDDERFRVEVRSWLADAMADPRFAPLRGRGHFGDMDGAIEGRKAWEHALAAGGWTCLSWPEAHGGRAATLYQEVIFHEEYARADAPGRVGHIGEGLLGPTLLAFGTPAQQARFLPPIVAGTELWCQGYSEPDAGSDLASLRCRAVQEADGWRITGQKVWTSLAEHADWCFVLCRTDPDAPRHRGISCLLVQMDQPGVRVVPIRQLNGSAEFAEVFFDGAHAAADHVVGPVNGGWKVAMATLAFERGASTLGQQLTFASELDDIAEVARHTGMARDPLFRDRFAAIRVRLDVMRLNALRTLSAHEAGGELPRAAMIGKLYWASLHRDMGELAMDALGDRAAEVHTEEPFARMARIFLWSRSETIYAGTNQIQRNLIATRALGLPR